ncbi:MAG: hypothetical protein D6736_14415 [Nitrospinota bacterium]|nr:MAG: hypothetical protein D6736_14415 [Nitrospinota bacterium]
MIIGKIVKSNSHIDYLCRILDRLETADPPQPHDYAFGQFVRIGTETVGIIYDSQLINPDYGNYGPRLTTPPEQNAVFSPDYLNEQATLVGILLLGWLEGSIGIHRVPRYVIPINTEVETMDEEAIRRFHSDQDQEFQLHYYSHILTHAGPIGIQLLLTVIEQLGRLFTEASASLQILQDTLSWQLTLSQIR